MPGLRAWALVTTSACTAWGIVSNGTLLRGPDGYAGNIFVGDDGFVELATLPGSLESFVGREAVPGVVPLPWRLRQVFGGFCRGFRVGCLLRNRGAS